MRITFNSEIFEFDIAKVPVKATLNGTINYGADKDKKDDFECVISAPILEQEMNDVIKKNIEDLKGRLLTALCCPCEVISEILYEQGIYHLVKNMEVEEYRDTEFGIKI